jgi:hypothetical protein
VAKGEYLVGHPEEKIGDLQGRFGALWEADKPN